MFSKHKVKLVGFFKVTVSGRVAGLIMGYWLCAANGRQLTEKQSFVSRSSREVLALAGDQTKAAIDTDTFALMLPEGGLGLIVANGNCDLLVGSF